MTRLPVLNQHLPYKNTAKADSFLLCSVFQKQCIIFPSNFTQIIRRCLVYIIVQPVSIQIITMRSPKHGRTLCTVVLRIIIERYLNGQILLFITHIFIMERISVIFRMPITKICRPSPAMARSTPASSDSAITSNSRQAWISSAGTVVCLLWGM